MIRLDITGQWEVLKGDPAAFQRYILGTYGADSFALAPFPYVALHTVDGHLLGYVVTYGLPHITLDEGRVILEISDLIIALPDRTGLGERLAELAHVQWSGWMAYIFEKSTRNDDGTVAIPAWAVERWTRQMTTPYADLSEVEQASDHVEADRVLAVLDEELKR